MSTFDDDQASKLYADILNAFAEHDVEATVEHTGGGCISIMVKLDRGFYAMIGDRVNGPLPWHRDDPIEWDMGIYGPDQDHTSGCEGYGIRPWGLGLGVDRDQYGYTADVELFVDAVAPLLRAFANEECGHGICKRYNESDGAITYVCSDCGYRYRIPAEAVRMMGGAT